LSFGKESSISGGKVKFKDTMKDFQ